LWGESCLPDGGLEAPSVLVDWGLCGDSGGADGVGVGESGTEGELVFDLVDLGFVAALPGAGTDPEPVAQSLAEAGGELVLACLAVGRGLLLDREHHTQTAPLQCGGWHQDPGHGTHLGS